MSESMGFDQELSFGDLETEKEALDNSLEAGTYDLQLTKWDYRASAAKGTPGVNFEFTVINDDDPKNNNRKVFHWCGWGSYFFKATILALFADRLAELHGMDVESAEYDDAKLKLRLAEIQEGISEDLDDAIGTVVVGEVTINSYKDKEGETKKNNKIKKFQ